MRKYLVTLVVALLLILLYQFINIRLFSAGLPTMVNNGLFKVFAEDTSGLNKRIVICNIGKLKAKEVHSAIDTLLRYNPKAIGINLCDFDDHDQNIFNDLKGNERIIIGNCVGGEHPLSAIVKAGNTVTHFKSDNPKSYEIVLSAGWPELEERGHEQERIYFLKRLFWQVDLAELSNFNPELFYDKIILIGYMGDYTMDFTTSRSHTIYNFKNCRITPLNEQYGYTEILPDMYDTEISAIIISSLQQRVFMNDIHPIVRVLILLLICLLNVALISIVQTRWIVLNIIFSLFIFILLTIGASGLIVYCFVNNYFLEIPEMTILLIIVTLFTLISVTSEKKLKHAVTDDATQ